METFSSLLVLCEGNPPVTGGFPSQKPVTRSFDVFFDLRLKKWLSKQSGGRSFETPSNPLWLHCNGLTRSVTPCIPPRCCYRTGQILNVAFDRTPEKVFYDALAQTAETWEGMALISYTVTESIHLDRIAGKGIKQRFIICSGRTTHSKFIKRKLHFEFACLHWHHFTNTFSWTANVRRFEDEIQFLLEILMKSDKFQRSSDGSNKQ